MNQISRRTLAKGAAWAAPMAAISSFAPAYAKSTDNFIKCTDTAAANLTANTASITSVVSGAYGQDTPTPVDGMPTSTALVDYQPGARGSLFGISVQLNPVPPVDVYGPDGKPTGRKTSGYYLVPTCGASNCVSGSGYSVPSPLPTLYDGNGDPHVGYIQTATPVGCSPLAKNTGASMLWTINTDLYYDPNICGAGPESHLYQVSLPFTIIYIDGLNPVYNTASTGCCHYVNMTFSPISGCTGSQSAQSFEVSSTPFGAAPDTPTDQAHIVRVVRAADGSTNGSYCNNKNVLDIYGANFTDAYQASWHGYNLPITVLNDNHIQVTMPTDSSFPGIFYPLVISGADGKDSNSYNIARQLGC